MSVAEIATTKGFDTLNTLLSNRLIGMVLTVALIETLQGVEIYKGNKKSVWSQGYQYGNVWKSGWVQEKLMEPLFSNTLATSLEATIISGAVMENLAKSLDLDSLKSLLAFVK